jgi:hypothetical protein
VSSDSCSHYASGLVGYTVANLVLAYQRDGLGYEDAVLATLAVIVGLAKVLAQSAEAEGKAAPAGEQN